MSDPELGFIIGRSDGDKGKAMLEAMRENKALDTTGDGRIDASEFQGLVNPDLIMAAEVAVQSALIWAHAKKDKSGAIERNKCWRLILAHTELGYILGQGDVFKGKAILQAMKDAKALDVSADGKISEQEFHRLSDLAVIKKAEAVVAAAAAGEGGGVLDAILEDALPEAAQAVPAAAEAVATAKAADVALPPAADLLAVGTPVGVASTGRSKHHSVGAISAVNLVDASTYPLRWQPLPLEYFAVPPVPQVSPKADKEKAKASAAVAPPLRPLPSCIAASNAATMATTRPLNTVVRLAPEEQAWLASSVRACEGSGGGGGGRGPAPLANGSRVAAWWRDGYYLGTVTTVTAPTLPPQNADDAAAGDSDKGDEGDDAFPSGDGDSYVRPTFLAKGRAKGKEGAGAGGAGATGGQRRGSVTLRTARGSIMVRRRNAALLNL